MFKAYLKEKKRSSDYTVSSAGLYARKGDVLSATANEALDFLQVKHTPDRRARPFTVLMAEDADMIVAMTERHAELIGEGDSLFSFEELIGRPIDDPFGGSLQSYLDCAAQIRTGFDEILRIGDAILSKKRESAK